MAAYFLQWRKRNRYSEVLRVCLPLVLSMSATTAMEFTDRVFLANYSIDAISAALPAGISSYLFMAFFGGVGGYAGIFIAQYSGKGKHKQIGVVLWQGIYFTLASGIIFWLLAIFATTPLFILVGHELKVQQLEEIYFSILCKGAILHVAMATLATFFTGRGITRPVMIVTFLGVLVNIPLDYALIFGRLGFSELGIEGAAIATVVAWAINVIFLAALIFTKKNNHCFGLFSQIQFNRDIFTRLMRFGIPGSLQFTLDILAFTFFILLIGRIGTTELAATNIVLSINALAFMPSMGVSQGLSVLVGQALGRKKPQEASRFVFSASHLLFIYIMLMATIFIFAPDEILKPFLASSHGTASNLEVLTTGKMLLKIVAAYLFFDAFYMIFSGALRGAGDTRFMMLATGFASLAGLIIPVYTGVIYLNIGVKTAWLWLLFFIFTLFLISATRYWWGAWKKMLVIETEP